MTVSDTEEWPESKPWDHHKALICRVCKEVLSIHKIDDQGAVALLECPTGDRRVIVFVSPT